MPAPTPPTVTEMQAAWEALRGPDWPPLDQLAAHARCYSLVQGQALRMARGLHKGHAAAPQSDHAQHHQASRHASPPLPRALPSFDGKRAACGERDDD